MNAVKRCLILLVATLVVGACGGDPTADDAGAGVTIRLTPGVIWVHDGSTASFLVEAVDKVGGTLEGSWTVSGTTGPLTVALDTTFQNTSSGPLGYTSKFIVTPTAAGEGTVTIAGTGGDTVIRVRIAPDPVAMDLVFTPGAVNDSVTVPLNSAVTVQAPTDVRFTATTTVRMMTGPLATNFAPFVPINFSIATDSTHLTFTPGPNSTGNLQIDGLANVSTPTLTSVARTHTVLVTDVFDTSSTNRIVLSTTTPAIGDTITATLPATYRFSPNTAVAHFLDTTVNGSLIRIATDGLAAAGVVSVSADSGTLRYIPAPGAHGRPRFSNIRVRANATSFVFGARTSQSYNVPSFANVAVVFSSTTPGTNVPLTITMPAGYKFRPTSAFSQPGPSTMTPVVISRSADSNSVVITPVPGNSGPITITGIKYSLLPSLSLSLPSSQSVTQGPATDLGADDPAASAVFAAPTTTGAKIVWFDTQTMTQPDPSPLCDGSAGAQYYTLTVSVTGSYTLSMNWESGADFDFGIMVKDGSYGGGGPGARCSDYVSTAGLSGAQPENITTTLTSGVTYVINAMDFAGDGAGLLWLSVTKN